MFVSCGEVDFHGAHLRCGYYPFRYDFLFSVCLTRSNAALLSFRGLLRNLDCLATSVYREKKIS